MKIEQLMSRELRTCRPHETADCAARIMWEQDCGVVPIVTDEQRIVGVMTDRDLCIAAYIQNETLARIPIASIGLKPVVIVRPHDEVEIAETLMERHQIRRLAVIDEAGRLVGMLSLSDLARGAGELSSDDIARTLAAVGQPRVNGRATA